MTYSASNPPKGSYLKTVTNIQILLVATAKNKNGQDVNASIVLPDDDQYELENNDGVLQVVPSQQGSPGVLPAGSYLQSCQHPRVLMQCDARKVDGSYVKSQIDLTDLKDPDIENCDGALIDDNVLDNALDEVAKLLPAEANDIDQQKENIKAYMAGTYTPPQPAGSLRQGAPIRADDTGPADNALFGISPCLQSSAALVVNVVTTLLAYRAFRRSQLLAIATAPEVIAFLNNSAVQVAIRRLADEIRNPTGAIGFATALGSFFYNVISMGLVKAIVSAAASQLSWWDMTKFGAVMFAEAAPLFTPAGPAVVYGKGLLLFLSLEGLAEDAIHVAQDCT